jgi:HAD superfamily hydrolase (TIGR01509 family)
MPSSADPILAIFDHDGVLVDSLDFHQQAWRELGARTGLPFTDEFIHKTFGMTNPAIFRELGVGDLPAEELGRYGDLKEACYRDVARGQVVLMNGVDDLIKGLAAAGFLLAIGTSGPTANMHLTIDECNLHERFTAIAALEDITRSKPDPEVFLTAARKAGVDPSRAAVFEDAVVGIQAAKAAGMWAIGVTSSRPAEALWEAGADEVFETLAGYPVDQLAERLRSR